MRTISAILGMMLVAVACGGADTIEPTDDTAGSTVSVSVTQSGTDQTTFATAVEPPPTTEAGETTTTTEAESYPALHAALAAAGTYAGTWTNTTFGSTGEASMTMTVTDQGEIMMEWDLGGFVFGATDPDGETQSLVIDDLVGGRVLDTALFGEIEISVSEDFTTLRMDAEDVPTAGIEAFRATAMWSDDGTITGTYVVEFEGGGEPAEGVFEMTRG